MLIISKIEIEGTRFKVSLNEDDSRGGDSVAIIEQTNLFELLRSAFDKKKESCENCSILDLPKEDPHWWCFKRSVRDNDCIGYEPKQ